MEKDEIVQLIKETGTAMFGSKQVGDTPTDANQLTPKKYVDGLIPFSGHVQSNGSAISLPDGWTSSKISTGLYEVTHNLGTTAYAVVACGDTTGTVDNDRTTCIEVFAANTFRVINMSTTFGGVEDGAFFFILIKS